MNFSCEDLVVTRKSARFLGRQFPCAVGRGGIGTKDQEGDGITPAGRFALEAVFYRPDRLSFYGHKLGINSGWSDDVSDPDYNGLVRRPHPYSHEALWRPDPLYDLVGVLDFNRNPVVRGAGSCIFLHVWRKPRHPTEGCIGFASSDLKWILTCWRRHSRVVVQS